MTEIISEPRYGRVEDVWAKQRGVRVTFCRQENGSIDLQIFHEDRAFTANANIASYRWDRIVEAMAYPEREAETVDTASCPSPSTQDDGDSEDLRTALSSVLYRYSREKVSITPVWILRDYIWECLKAFERGVNEREKCFRIRPGPGKVR